MAADVEDSARTGKAKVATKKRGGSGKSHGGGGKSLDSCHFEAQRSGGARNTIRNYRYHQPAEIQVIVHCLLFLLHCCCSFTNHFLYRRKKPAVKEPPSKRAKPSPASVPPTPDVPAPSPACNNTYMEDVGGQFGPMPEANPMTEATANDVVQSNQASGSFQGHRADVSAGSSSFWKQKQLEIVKLITSQEDASNQLSSGITAFVERTSTMKKVCIPSSPRAPWRIFINNPSWCSKRNYL
jgi:hypothetical protein